jgi:hypothetical protein
MINICDEYNICFYSSFIFLTNVVIAYWYGYYLYARLFFLLTITSILFHSTLSYYANINDKIAITLIVLYGGNLFFEKYRNQIPSVKYWILSFLIILTFLATVYLYIYGFITNQYCFYEDRHTANLYHSLLHIISSIGHILVMIM